MILGKRARLDMAPATAPPKRSRARREERVHVNDAGADSASTLKSRSGLLTPEPSVLPELMVPTPTTLDVALSPTRATTAHTFPFMKLPAELRLHVYYMALVRAHPISLHAERLLDKPDDDTTTTSSSEPSPARLLSTTTTLSHPSPTYTTRRTARTQPENLEPRPPSDPITPSLLRLNAQIHKEARQLLYAENVFTLTLSSGIHTLSTLHQRSRSLIKHVILTIPSHHDILDGFADLVRLGLRYCWGLKSFKIILQASLPDDGRVSGATSVYANAFHILRWLPRGCSVLLEGCVSETVRRVVCEEGRLMSVLDEVSWTVHVDVGAGNCVLTMLCADELLKAAASDAGAALRVLELITVRM
jgi:epsin